MLPNTLSWRMPKKQLETNVLPYLSSFCGSFHSNTRNCPYGTTAKIRRLQKQLGLSDLQLAGLVRSYGPLTDTECQKLLFYSIHGCLSGIKAALNTTRLYYPLARQRCRPESARLSRYQVKDQIHVQPYAGLCA